MKFFCLHGALFIRSCGLLGGLFMELFGWLGGPFIDSFGWLGGLLMDLLGLLGGLCIDLQKSFSVALDLPENKQAFFILFWIVLVAECLLRLTLVHLLALLVLIFTIGTKWLTWNSFDLSVKPDASVIIINLILGSCCISPTLGL